MELPPNDALGAYEAFYLDWDCFYNNEPYYKGFRDLSYPDYAPTQASQLKTSFKPPCHASPM